MISELVIATNNPGKLAELQSLLKGIRLLTLRDISFRAEIPEPFHTFKENAWTKAQTIFDFCGRPVMADDSGLCIDALNGKPGVLSARYAGNGASDADNLEKALNELGDTPARSAHYTAVICLLLKGDAYYFEGHCHGAITMKPAGTDGFGYDPIFVPDGYDQTFAQLPQSVKNGLSHRGKAVRDMVRFITDNV